MRPRRRATVTALAALALTVLGTFAAPAALASSAPKAVPLADCADAPVPEVPGRGVVGFFESPPKVLPPDADPFAENADVSIYEVYGYAGVRWNTYDLGCGSDIVRNPDASIGTAIGNWMLEVPTTMIAATGAVLDAAFTPDFLGVFDPLITNVVDTLQRTVFERWAFVVVAAVGLLLIWRSRHAALASSAGAIGWALLVMVLVTMVLRWPLVAGHAADQTVATTLSAVSSGLNGRSEDGSADAGTAATSGMHQALLYESWLGGTFGSTDSDVAKKYGPVVFDATALTWREAAIMQSDPAQGRKIIEAKQDKFEAAAGEIKAADPDAYEYLTGKRSDSRVGYAMLALLATLCTVPFLFVAGLLVLGALIIVRFGVMLFPAFATLGLFPTMRTLVTGIGSTMAAALINAMVFGIGASVTVLGMGVLLSPTSGTPGWLSVILMLLLTIVMWVALRPFRRLTQMVSNRDNHFSTAADGVSTSAKGAARTSGRILTGALSTFLGVSTAQRANPAAAIAEAQAAEGRAPQRVEGIGYYPTPVTAEGAAEPAALSNTVTVNAGQVTVVRGQQPAEAAAPAEGEIYAPVAGNSRVEAATVSGSGAGAGRASGRAAARDALSGFGGGAGERENTSRDELAGRVENTRPDTLNREFTTDPPVPVGSEGWRPQDDGAPVIRPGDKGFQRSESVPPDTLESELDEVFRPHRSAADADDHARQR
ncbi:hypothetical protein LWF15_34425 [Kineosporia rhizophila]|uniref:hypothetical protein n=1 Tax=Kineosporia TaxID=49184 RepID=UPI001E3CCBDB|nr:MULTISPECIES: hypothetical protein [Kineosporia]MCE0540604.1 hypothetical protein [Kineosporia rhizophila]GLY14103.1 hypothetical protein Kisp01_11190 [Kineosporia sp. NBRC 101677]